MVLIGGNLALATTTWNPFPDKIDRKDAVQPELVKMEINSAVYYKAANGYRYVFPNENTYKSWYSIFSAVKIISQSEMEKLVIGGNITYKPNSRLVKITTDPKVYWVGKNSVLRWLSSEALAKEMFGNNWAALVDDLPDAYFAPPTYTIGDPLKENNRPTIEENWAIDDNLNLFLPTDSTDETGAGSEVQQPVLVDAEEQPISINLTGITENERIKLSWSIVGGNSKYGMAIVKSIEENPVYPKDEYAKVSANETEYDFYVSVNTSWYLRVCRLNSDNTCSTYSNNISMLVGTSDKVIGIDLAGTISETTAKLSWQLNWVSPNYGFYLIYGKESNPEFRDGMKVWLAKTEKNYNWSDLESGTHHFRICRFDGPDANRCSYYSNDIQLTIN
jgi:hypothetical protein